MQFINTSFQLMTQQKDNYISSPNFSPSFKVFLPNPIKIGSATPGPGTYKLRSMFDDKGGFSIPSSKYHHKVFQKPDPWSYVPNLSIVKPNSSQATFGSSSRLNTQQPGPSPAHYNTNYKVLFHSIRSPVFRKQKIVNKQRESSPGPGNYDLSKVDSIDSKGRSVKIGLEKRQLTDKQKESLPAPNVYQSESDIDLGMKKRRGFSMGQKLKYHTETAAPFDYLKYNNFKESLMSRSPAFSFKRSAKKEANEDSPGPAKYDPERHRLKGIVIPKSERRLHNLSENPGPEAYSIDNRQESPSFSIPKAKYQGPTVARTPGPGLYTPKIAESRKYKAISIGLGDRPALVRGEKQPGPGEYNLVRKGPSGGYSIGKGERGVGREESSPGPADYSVDVSSLKKYLSNFGI